MLRQNDISVLHINHSSCRWWLCPSRWLLAGRCTEAQGRRIQLGCSQPAGNEKWLNAPKRRPVRPARLVLTETLKVAVVKADSVMVEVEVQVTVSITLSMVMIRGLFGFPPAFPFLEQGVFSRPSTDISFQLSWPPCRLGTSQRINVMLGLSGRGG